MYLSVIIPAYNEEKRLPKTLKEIDRYLRQQNYPSAGSGRGEYEIIVVNDGSSDKTAEAVECLKPVIKHLRLIDNKINHGKGFVIHQGMLDAKGEYRVFTDADNSTSICHLEKMLPEFKNGYDIVIGSRDMKGAILEPPQPIHRRILGDVFRLLTQITCGTWKILDSQCGFKGFTAKAAEHIFPKCKINRFAFDPEILVLAKKLGFKVKEIPVTWKNDIESKVKFKSMLKMGLDLLKIRWNIITQKYD